MKQHLFEVGQLVKVTFLSPSEVGFVLQKRYFRADQEQPMYTIYNINTGTKETYLEYFVKEYVP